jgi:hypothetical protein
MLPDKELDAAIFGVAETLAAMPSRGLYRFAPEAAGELKAIEAFKAKECERLNGPICQWLDKLPNEFGRWSLAFHMVEWCASPVGRMVGGAAPEWITLETAQRARRFLIEFAFPHAQSFYRQWSTGPTSTQSGKSSLSFILTRKMESIRAAGV